MSENSKQFFLNLDVESEDRYDLAKFLEFTDNYDPLSSTFLNELSAIELGGEYVVNNEEGRPDLVSYNIYRTTKYWQIILLYNGYDDVDAIRVGMKLKFPNLAKLEELFFGLKSRQSSSEQT